MNSAATVAIEIVTNVNPGVSSDSGMKAEAESYIIMSIVTNGDDECPPDELDFNPRIEIV